MDEPNYEETYAQMLDGELGRALRGKRSLVPEAAAALDREVQKRNLDPEHLRTLKGHSVERRLTTAEKRLKGKRLRLSWGVALFVTSFMLARILDLHGVESLFEPICITISVPAFAVWGFWELKSRLWFWGVLSATVIANIVLFRLIGWPLDNHWLPGRSIMGGCTLELISTFALIARIQKRMIRNHPEASRIEPHLSQADKIETTLR